MLWFWIVTLGSAVITGLAVIGRYLSTRGDNASRSPAREQDLGRDPDAYRSYDF